MSCMEEQKRALYLEYLRVAQERKWPINLIADGKTYTTGEMAREISEGTGIGQLIGLVMDYHAVKHGTTVEKEVAGSPPPVFN
jgi:hypothetical protein